MSRATRTFVVAFIGVMLLIPVFAFARIDDTSSGLRAAGGAAGLSNFCSGSASSCIATIVGRVINVALGFLGIVLLGYFLYGGFLWMTSGGDSKQASEAKQVFLNAVIGTFIIGSSFAISNFVLTQLGNVVTGDGGTVASTSDPSASSDSSTSGGTPSCCYTTGDECVTACNTSPAFFGLTAASPVACGNICADARHPRTCGALPTGIPTCGAVGRTAPTYAGTPEDACIRFRCSTPLPAAICTPPVCPLSDCPSTVTNMTSLLALWGRSMTADQRTTCTRCLSNNIDRLRGSLYPNLDETCIPALTNLFRTACDTQCGGHVSP